MGGGTRNMRVMDMKKLMERQKVREPRYWSEGGVP